MGADTWAGTDGWVASTTGDGVHGIDENMIPDLGKTAFLGGSQPGSIFTTVYKPINLDPISNGTPIVEFETLMGIQDSTNDRRDSFFLTFYNLTGDFLAAIGFSYEADTFGLWRLDDTNSQHDTELDFIPGELHLLYTRVDFRSNTWSADLDGIPLFTNATFNSSGRALTFGGVAAQWQLTASQTPGYGDNWLLVADWYVRANQPGSTPFQVKEPAPTISENRFSLTWTAEPELEYKVEYSSDLLTWHDDLPGSVFSNVVSERELTFIDTTASDAPRRYYRVTRTWKP